VVIISELKKDILKENGIKENKKIRTLNKKIFFYLIGFCSIILVLIWFFQIIFLEDFYKSTKKAELEKYVMMIERNVSTKKADEFWEERYELLGGEEYIKDYTIDIYVAEKDMFDENYVKLSLLDDTRPLILKNSWEYLIHLETRDRFFERALGNGGKYSEIVENLIISTKIVKTTDDFEIVMYISAELFPVTATVNTIKRELAVITSMMIIIAFVLSYFISRRLAEPIERINSQTKLIAMGKYDVTFHADEFEEIKELSDTLNHMTKELSKVEKLRKDLIANVSHDLKTPLTLISGYAEAMRDLPGENNFENAQVIIDEAGRLSLLVTDMLDLSKFETGNGTLNINKFNLTGSMKEVNARFSELVKKDGYTITFNHGEEVYVNADEVRIQQVFYNLMTNAINYTGKDKTIVINQIVENDYVRIEVIDTGRGITKENLDKIWERYYSTDEFHERGVTGTGIGLSIVRSIIESHSGKYGVVSEPDKGSKFWFALKVDESDFSKV